MTDMTYEPRTFVVDVPPAPNAVNREPVHRTVDAFKVEIEDGHLKLFDGLRLTAGFAPGTWLTFEEAQSVVVRRVTGIVDDLTDEDLTDTDESV